MGLTQVSTDGVKSNAINTAKINNGSIQSEDIADNQIITDKILDGAVSLAKLPHGDSNNNGKFLRANNGADPTFETVSTDLVADTSPQLGGNLDTNGNGIAWGDAETASFGDNTDLQIYHSTDNIIKNAVTGKSLKILSANNNVAAVFEDNASVELYEAGSKKFETTSYGALVSGELQATGANFTDDGQSSPIVSVLADDGNPWGLAVGNSAYSDNAQYGWNLYVNSQGQAFNYNIGVNSFNDWNWFLSNSSTSKQMIKCSGAALSVELYNDSNKKFSTTSNGIEVHGSTDNARISFGDAYSNSSIGYVGLNRFAIDSHDGLEVRDVSDSYATRMKIASDGITNIIGKGSGFALQTAHHCIQNSNTTSWAMQAVNTGSLGYGVEIRVNAATASREALYVYSTADSQAKASILSNGTFNSRTNSYGSLSDVKLKENIVDASSQWNDLKAIKVRNFNFISDTSNTKLLGVVAQELETVCPSLVETTTDKKINEQGERVETETSTKSVKYSVLYMKAIKALQEAQTRIETLETKVAALEAA